MKTYYAKEADITRNWHIVDAKGKVLGRIASEIAKILQGKHKTIYSPGANTGDFVIVINAGEIKMTGNKLADKIYYHHTGFIGGIRSITAGKQLQKDPTELVKLAVKNMLPKGPLGRDQLRMLKVYAGESHPHSAQNPKTLAVA